jgi:RNA 2',3'-cyclic 3'-phosphodiesterase
MRLFFGIPILPEIKTEISARLEPLAIPGKIVPKENYHVTLLFLGNVLEDPVKKLVQELKNQTLPPPFQITLGGLGAFPNPSHARTLWMGVKESFEVITRINSILNRIVQQAGFKTEEESRFIPHLTLTRLKRPQNLSRFIIDSVDSNHTFTVDRFVLFESLTGLGLSRSRYEERESFPLNR